MSDGIAFDAGDALRDLARSARELEKAFPDIPLEHRIDLLVGAPGEPEQVLPDIFWGVALSMTLCTTRGPTHEGMQSLHLSLTSVNSSDWEHLAGILLAMPGLRVVAWQTVFGRSA